MNNNKKINAFQYAILIIFPILSIFNGIGFHNIIKISKRDCYFSVLFSYLIGLIILAMIIYISNYEKDKNIHEKINIIFGKPIGNIINAIINIIIFIICIVTIYGICNFVTSQFLSETPVLVIGIMIGIVIVYNITKGIEVITRSNIIFLAIILTLSIISFISLIPQIDKSNLKPILENGLIPPLKGSIYLTLTNIVPTLAILTIPKSKVIDYPKINKFLIISYTLSYIIIFLISIKTISILGLNLTEIYEYPEYIVLKKISLFNFFDKIENIIFIKWILTSFSTLSLLIYYLNNSIKTKKQNIITPIIITTIIVLISTYYFKNNTLFTNFIETKYSYINLILLAIFAIITISIVIKKKFTT